MTFRTKSSRLLIIAVFSISFLLSLQSYAQSYGLGFNGKDFSKDLRTGIDLSPKDYFSFDGEVELRFKMSLRPNVNMYFGYIVRIIDDHDQNIDLIFNYRSIDSSSIDIISGQKHTGISVKTDINQMCNKWTEFRLRLNFISNTVSLLLPETNFQSQGSGMNMSGKIKILFGVNDFSRFKTSDLPGMKIKDISIFEKGKLKYNWPLDEIDGTHAKDTRSGKIADIKNPMWLKQEDTNWRQIFSSKLIGKCQLAFNSKDEKIYLIGADQMIIYSAKNGLQETITYKNKFIHLLPGRQAIYNPDTKTIFSYDIDHKMVAEFDPNTMVWKEENPANTNETVFLHHNQFYSASEKSLIVFAGYGQHEYKNTVQKISLLNGSWEILKPGGDVFNPRYLASSGALNDTVYILGGYGSISGKQILNPQYFFDLMAFSLKDKKFTKIYEFVPPFEDICFSNSMVIDPETRTFYALSFPILKYDTSLQLIKGSLQSPDIKPIASKIPFLFYDIKSFSSLYYCESGKKLVAATLLLDDQNQTEINLYSIAFPPNENSIELNSAKSSQSFFKYLAAFGIILFLVLLFLFVRFKRSGKAISVGPIGYKRGKGQIVISDEPDSDNKELPVNSIFFFGGFQVFDRIGNDITVKFSPLLKELFLMIWLFSIKNNQGVSSEKLTELLWFDKDEHSAKNNRAVNIAKLKQILAELDFCCLSHKTSYWKIETDDTVIFNDYHECIKILNHNKTLTNEKIRRLIALTQKGSFLMNTGYEWIDEFKADISNRIIDVLAKFASVQKIEEDAEFILELADSIFNFDMVNEQALILKCKALTFLGKHSIASNIYTKFARDYKVLYGEAYNIAFNEIINIRRIQED